MWGGALEQDFTNTKSVGPYVVYLRVFVVLHAPHKLIDGWYDTTKVEVFQILGHIVGDTNAAGKILREDPVELKKWSGGKEGLYIFALHGSRIKRYDDWIKNGCLTPACLTFALQIVVKSENMVIG